MNGEAVCRAGPSLALIKYWGKSVKGDNLPATPSLAVTLGGVYSETRARVAENDSITVDGVRQEETRFAPFFDALRRSLGVTLHFHAASINTFPTSAGMASSSSGFAALAGACARAAGGEPTLSDLSSIARTGSASAARAVYGGFVLLPAGARRARPVFGPDYWPELRIVVAITQRGPKPVSSRRAMEETRAGSPYYFSWIKESAALLPDALRGLEGKDLELLGETARRSYSLMHAAILGARPPILYWLPATVALIHGCAALRADGTGAWETIDAGPQVKILCLAAEAEKVMVRLQEYVPGVQTILCRAGPGLTWGEPEGEIQLRVSIPGSILLLGEYAVLEEGGLGLALAVERRVRIDIAPSEDLSIEGVWPGGALSWTPGRPSASPLIAAIVDEVEMWLRERGGGKELRGACMRVDSSDLFSPEGRKSGLGSSAAVTAGLVCALLDAAGCRPDRADPEVLALAVRAHRRSQGGAGSGYDVSCSFHGGMGVFHGGHLPGWEPCRLWEDPVVCLFPGPSPVSTSEAIRSYALWKKSNPGDARQFVEDSNRSVQGFVRAPSAVEAERHMRACRELGLALGRTIGVSAEIEAPRGMHSAWCKALGAGNELGACLLPAGSARGHPGKGIQAVDAANEGILWQE